MKITVISNCQSEVISQYINILSPGNEASWIDCHRLEPDAGDRIVSELRSADRIFTAPLVGQHLQKEILTEFVKSEFPNKVVTIPNCYFAGFFPDQTYLGGLFDRIAGGAGGIHSTVAVDGFLLGLAPKAAASRFNDPEYFRSAGLFSKFDESRREMKRRDEGLDIPLFPIFENLMDRRQTFYTMNHPTRDILTPLIKEILRASGLKFRDVPAYQMPDPLWHSIVWPISRCVIDRFKLNLEASDVISLGYPDYKYLTMEEFCLASYESFESSIGEFVSSHQVKSRIEVLGDKIQVDGLVGAGGT
jgi:hypothetical protein